MQVHHLLPCLLHLLAVDRHRSRMFGHAAASLLRRKQLLALPGRFAHARVTILS
jgi:hypothetical protein